MIVARSSLGKALVERLRSGPVVDPRCDEFTERVTDERILDIKRLYLTDLDAPDYLAFLAECDEAHEAHKAHGYNIQPGYCPALIAEDELIQAQNALIKSGAQWLGIEGDLYGEHRAKMLDLLLGACLQPATTEERAAP